MSRLLLSLCALPLLVLSVALAAEPEEYNPPIAAASNEGRLAIEGFHVPEGFQVELVAAEPMLANPVAFDIDARGRFYVCETFRQQKGVEDNRNHMDWLHDDLAAQTVADRLAYLKKHLGEKISTYTEEQDRIRLLEDCDGDGTADKATVFAGGFNDVLDGTGAGVLAHQGDVYYTCIPKLYRLKDTDGDGRADVQKVLSEGYGVRFAFRGHDMHGLTVGPDGRLYFSIGDRGFHVETDDGRTLHHPDTGAVLRCEMDGSNLEVFAIGLRNPQELAFDDYGNLFTADNNSDSGDRARWVHVAPGMDAGWRMYYQYLPDRGPWNREMMWYPHDTPPLENPGPGGVPKGTLAADVQPAYIVPPVANLGDGPSGLTYYPGVGLPERYDGHFFLCDFRGGAGQSGIRSFAVKPKGASFELIDSHEFLWSTLATDVDFGYDGHLYWTDWVNGWNGEGKGRLYRLTHPDGAKEAAEVAKLFHEGFGQRSVKELAKLLGHADRRVRLAAQFTLVDKSTGEAIDRAEEAIESVAVFGKERMPRLHAIWAIGQLIRRGHLEPEALILTMTGEDDELRAQAVKTFGDVLTLSRYKIDGGTVQTNESPDYFLTRVDEVLIDWLKDPSPRVRFFAALATGKLGAKSGIAPLLNLLEQAGDDPNLRHAAVMGLVGIGRRHPAALFAAADHSNPAARIGVLLALRRLNSPEVVRFLNDAEPQVVLEAARAINDVPIEAAQDKLAALAGTPGMSDPLLRRVLNANFRLGGKEHAEAVANVAARTGETEALRVEALEELLMWEQPAPTDRVTGMWRPLAKRDAPWMAEVLRPKLGGLLSRPDAVRERAIKLAARHGVKDVEPALVGLLQDTERSSRVRAEALRALKTLQSPQAEKLAREAIDPGDHDPRVRAEARRILAKTDPELILNGFGPLIAFGEIEEIQPAVALLAEMQSPAADKVLVELVDTMTRGNLAKAIWLDVINAAEKRDTPELRAALEKFEASRSTDDPLAQYLEALEGGDAKRGEEIFFGRSDVSCRRCHVIGGSGGEVGPDLSAIGKQKDRRYLLESIVQPSAQIAKGFETVLLATDEGQVLTGVIKGEDERTIRLMDKNGAVTLVPKDSVVQRAEGKSAMPEDLIKFLTKSDLRDVIEYLARQQAEPKEAAGHEGS